MDKRNLTIIGSYDTRAEALTALDQLRNEGYNKDDIVLFANATIIEQFGLDTLSSAEVEATGGSDDDRSMWEKIKDAFSFGDYDHRTIDDESDPLFAYRDDLGQDRLVVGVYDYHATDRIEETDTAIIDQPVTGETAMPDESVHPTPRMGDSDIETPINDPNHLRNL